MYVGVSIYTHIHTHTYSTNYYLSIKKKEILPLVTTWMALKALF